MKIIFYLLFLCVCAPLLFTIVEGLGFFLIVFHVDFFLF